MARIARHVSTVPLCTFLVFLSYRALRVSSFTFINHLSIRSTAFNVQTHEHLMHLKNGGRLPDSIRTTGHRASMSQADDLSEEDQARSKKLADAWIRQDKASECSKLLQVHVETLVCCWASNEAASVFLQNHRAKVCILLDQYPQELSLSLCFFPRGLEVTGNGRLLAF